MKRISDVTVFVLSLCFLIIVMSCEGPTGPAGADGIDGNANVKTETFRVYSHEWGSDYPFYGVDKSSNILSKDIIDNGAALLYWEIGDGMWMALPLSTVYYGVAENIVSVVTESSSLTQSTQIFKLVAIQGYQLAKSADIDFSNYDEVRTYFNLD